MRKRRLAYHKRCAERLASGRHRTLFVLIAPATNETWQSIKRRGAMAPYLGAFPDQDTGHMVDFDEVELPKGAQECVVIDRLDLRLPDYMALARTARAHGMRRTFIVHPAGNCTVLGGR